MENIKVESCFTNNNKILELKFENDSIEIDLEDDIDFTELVERLTFLISEKKKIEFMYEEVEDEKLEIVFNTLKNIINVFNETIDKYNKDLVVNE